MLEYFFAPRDSANFEPCGMFTAGHIISSSIFIVLVIVALIFTVKMSEKSFTKLLRIFAIVITALEIVKIIYNFSYNYTRVDAWVPLAFCSIFIYSLWLSAFAKGFLKKAGDIFLAVDLYAGLFFMIFPTTSLMLHPIFHYLCIHSLLFHSSMIYIGFMVIIRNLVKPGKTTFLTYVLYLAIFSIIAIIINTIYNSNLMFYSAPYNMPIKLVVDIYNFSPVLYSIFIFFAYSALYLLYFITYKIIFKIKKGAKNGI